METFYIYKSSRKKISKKMKKDGQWWNIDKTFIFKTSLEGEYNKFSRKFGG